MRHEHYSIRTPSHPLRRSRVVIPSQNLHRKIPVMNHLLQLGEKNPGIRDSLSRDALLPNIPRQDQMIHTFQQRLQHFTILNPGRRMPQM